MSSKSGYIHAYNSDHENCPLYEVAGCPLFRGCLSIEVHGRTVGTFRIVCYTWVSAFQGCSLRGVPLYTTENTLNPLSASNLLIAKEFRTSHGGYLLYMYLCHESDDVCLLTHLPTKYLTIPPLSTYD